MQQFDLNSDNGKVTIMGLPDECPYCHLKITPKPGWAHYRTSLIGVEVTLVCPNYDCNKSFIGYYDDMGGICRFMGQTSLGYLAKKEFEKTISNISPNFIYIYNQAFEAEQMNLLEICGVGYRKALEFLIKDYLILKNPDEKVHIEKLLLGRSIEDFISDPNIKSVSKRAVWLGNDETHYLRKWEGKNLQDLKKLIDLTVHWIEMEALTQSFETEMPDKI